MGGRVYSLASQLARIIYKTELGEDFNEPKDATNLSLNQETGRAGRDGLPSLALLWHVKGSSCQLEL